MTQALTSARELLRTSISRDALIYTKTILAVYGQDYEFEWIFDIRNISLEPEVMSAIASLFWATYADLPECQIGGIETASLPLIAAITLEGSRRGKRVHGFYIRKSRKKTGLLKQIEGQLTKAPIILVDDLINTGSSFGKQIELLGKDGHTVHSIFTLVRFRTDDAYETILNRGIHIDSVFTLKDFSLPYPLNHTQAPKLSFQQKNYFHSKRPDLGAVRQKSTPIPYEHTLLWATDNGHIWSLDRDSLKPKWHRKLGIFSPQHVFTTPLLWEDTLFCGTHNGLFYKINARTGAIQNRRSLGQVLDTPVALPETHLLLLAVKENPNSGKLVALDMRTLDTLWEHPTKGPLTSSPVLKTNGEFLAIDSLGYWYTGTAQGVKRCKPGILAATSGKPAYSIESDQVTWITTQGDIYTSPAASPRPKKLLTIDFGCYSALSTHDHLILVPSVDHTLYALSRIDGSLVWKFKTAGRIFASPVADNNIVYIGSNDARLYAIAADSGQLLGMFQAHERITAPIMIESHDSILVTTYANELLRLQINRTSNGTASAQ
jgi:outer membrane protein assembly factor BamB/orotate phosphoribosyltransferase